MAPPPTQERRRMPTAPVRLMTLGGKAMEWVVMELKGGTLVSAEMAPYSSGRATLRCKD